MVTDRHSAAAEAQTSNTEISSLLAVKQDFSRLTSSLHEKRCSGDSVVSAVSEGEESTEADIDVVSAASDVADVTADKTDSAEHVEVNSNCEAQDETAEDEFQHARSCNAASYDLESHELDECYNSASSHTEGGLVLQPDKFCDRSSNDTHTASDQLSEAKFKKVSMKRESAEYTSSADKRLASPVVKKLRCKTETSPSQLLKTSSGTFLVQQVADPGETV